MNTEQKLLEIQKLLSEVVGDFEIRSLRILNIDKPFSRTLDDNTRSIRELHRGLHTSGQLDTWITNLRRADKLTNESEQLVCTHCKGLEVYIDEYGGKPCKCTKETNKGKWTPILISKAKYEDEKLHSEPKTKDDMLLEILAPLGTEIPDQTGEYADLFAYLYDKISPLLSNYN